ncbi:unnamed protein product, partial [Brenthis ino]
MCALYINFLETTCKDTNEDLVLTVNGQKLTNWVEKIDTKKKKLLQKNYTITGNETMNITCEARKRLKIYNAPEFYYRIENQTQEIDTKHHCTKHKDCKKISVNLTVVPGSSLTCNTTYKSGGQRKIIHLVLFFFMIKIHENKTAVSHKMLAIKGLKTENIRFDNGTIISYKFKHGDEIELTCLRKPTRHGKFNLAWYKNGQSLTRTKEKEVKQNFLLHDVDNGSLITCGLDGSLYEDSYDYYEDIPPYYEHHENISIVLLYEKHITNTKGPTTKVQTKMASAPDNKIAVANKLLEIKGLKTENIRFDNETIISYKFKHGDKIELTCLRKPTRHSKFNLAWYKNGRSLTTSYFEDEVKLNSRLYDVDDGSLITCTLDEDVDQNGQDLVPYHESKSIILLNEKYITNTEGPMTTAQSKMTSAPDEKRNNTDETNIGNNIPLIVVPVAVGGLVAVVAGVIIFVWKKNETKKSKKEKDDMLSEETTISKDEPRNEWEFPRHRIRLCNIVGEGTFGQIWRAKAMDIDDSETTDTGT